MGLIHSIISLISHRLVLDSATRPRLNNIINLDTKKIFSMIIFVLVHPNLSKTVRKNE
jgi:hypothetical protein